MKITIDGKISADPKDRILALEACTRSICEATGQDPAEAAMMLLTAAVHMSMAYAKKDRSIAEVATVLAESLDDAIVCADEFFKLKEVRERAAIAEGNDA